MALLRVTEPRDRGANMAPRIEAYWKLSLGWMVGRLEKSSMNPGAQRSSISGQDAGYWLSTEAAAGVIRLRGTFSQAR